MYNFDTINSSILINKKVFKPNLTSKLSFDVACKKIKNGSEVLDLGCGSFFNRSFFPEIIYWLEPPSGIEPLNCSLRNCCSTPELRWLEQRVNHSFKKP